MGLPYWDWSKDWDTLPDLWEGMISPIKDSHVFNWDSANCQGKNQDFSQRIKEEWREKDTKRMVKLYGGIQTTMKQRKFTDFMAGLSSNHNFIHNGLQCTMAPSQTAAYDPIFWLHHSYVDKVFADWQKNHARPILNISNLEPFNKRDMNKFYHRTHKTPDETLDYTKNLCYCYDDIENCQGEEIFYVDVDGNRHYPAFKTAATTQQQAFTPPHNTAATPPLPQSAHVELLLDQINHEFEIYVALVVPKHIGRRVVKYEICREGNDGED